MKNALSRHFDFNVNQCSPVCPDDVRVVRHDDDGSELVTYEPFDYPSFQKQQGFVSDWSLTNLLKAGINPDFPIRTGYNTRLDGYAELDRIAAAVDGVLNENKE